MKVHQRGNLYASTSYKKNDKPMSPWVVECSCGETTEHLNAQAAFHYQNSHAMRGHDEGTTTLGVPQSERAA